MDQLNINSSTLPSHDFTADQTNAIREAIAILESKLRATEVFTEPSAVKEYCRLKIAHKRDEFFCCLFLCIFRRT